MFRFMHNLFIPKWNTPIKFRHPPVRSESDESGGSFHQGTCPKVADASTGMLKNRTSSSKDPLDAVLRTPPENDDAGGLNFFKVCCLLFFLVPASTFAAPKVVVSIKPIHALVEGIMEGVEKPDLLMSAKDSPHHFHLTPSKIQSLEEADLVIWVGPQIETTLERTLKNSIKSDKVITLIDITQLTLYQQPSGQTDGHIWLDPQNAKKIIAYISQKLSELDPENKPIYQQNACQLLARIDSLTDTLKVSLEATKDTSFFVYHDAYQYFERAFNLQRGFPITLEASPDIRAQQRLNLKKLAQENQISCIFSEPQHGTRVVENLAEELGLYVGLLDPLGIDSDNKGENPYIILMQNLAKSYLGCLKLEEVDDQT